MRIKLTEDRPNQNLQHRKNQIIPNACMKTNKIETLNSFWALPPDRTAHILQQIKTNTHTHTIHRRKLAVYELQRVMSMVFLFLPFVLRLICLKGMIKKKNRLQMDLNLPILFVSFDIRSIDKRFTNCKQHINLLKSIASIICVCLY